jgi:hypothetical protein
MKPAIMNALSPHIFAQRFLRTVLPLLSIAILCGVAAACPTCREGLAENDPQGQALAAGFFYSILLMMGMPFVIVGVFGGVAYLSIRRAKAKAALDLVTESA